jgi:hypothetical protein
MNIVSRFLAVGALAAAVVSPALADSTGIVNVSGGIAFNSSALNFIQAFATKGDAGMVSGLSSGTVTYLGNTNYMDAVTSPIEIFTITNAEGIVLAFFDTDNAASNLSLSGSSADGSPGQAFAGSGGLSAPNLQQALISDPAAIVAADEPASGVLLGSGLLTIAALLYIRRRKVRPAH